jgi:hypothetical protein
MSVVEDPDSRRHVASGEDVNDQDVRGVTSVLTMGLGPRADSGAIAVPNT